MDPETADDWLAAATEALGASTGADLTLTSDEVTELLDLARDAAHDSGAKLNAPLVCFLVGRASAAGELTVAELAGLVRAATAVPVAVDGAA